MKFHRFAPSPCSGTGRIGWKIIVPPAFESPEFMSPSAKVSSKRANNAHTSEIGFESFLAVSARSVSEAVLASCALATGANEMNASRVTPKYDRNLALLARARELRI
jgi:hypothetical protein